MSRVNSYLGKNYEKIFGNKEEGFIDENTQNEIKTINKVIKNIEQICKRKKVKIGEIESAAGVSQGYISRLKDSNKKKIDINLIVMASNILQVPLDFIINGDAEIMFPIEILFLDFIKKLYNETYDDIIMWQKYKKTTGIIKNKDLTINLSNIETAEDLKLCYECFKDNNDDIVINNDAYMTQLKSDGSYVILFNINKVISRDLETKEIKKSINNLIEMYIVKNNKTNFVGRSDDMFKEMGTLLDDLYILLYESNLMIEVNEDVKDVMKAYL